MTTLNLPRSSKSFQKCSLPYCSQRAKAFSYCATHYYRLRTHGDPEKTSLVKGRGNTFEERFWSRVDKTPGLGPNGQCWLWQGRPNKGGYGRVTFNGRLEYTHRVAWCLVYGEMPKSEMLRHSCDIPLCCNPACLAEGTNQDNSNDKVLRNRQLKGEDIPQSKLTEADVLAIRSTNQSVPNSFIASTLGVSRRTVAMARSGETWRHVVIVPNAEEVTQ